MAMKLSEAIIGVEEVMTIIGTLLDLSREENLIKAAFTAVRPYEEDGEPKTERGSGTFTITCNGEGDFEPHEASFESKGENHKSKVSWEWDGEHFGVVENLRSY